MEHREARLGLALVISDHVGVCHRARGHELLLSERFHRTQPVAQHRGLLKIQSLCRSEHLFSKRIGKLRVFSLQKKHRLLHPRTVFRGRARKLAPCVTVIHMIVEAGPLFSKITRKFFRASGKLQCKPDGIDHALGHKSSAVGPKVARAVSHDAADELHGRILVPHVDAQIGIALIVFQENIIFRHVPLDERALEHQRLKLARRDDDVKVVNLADHPARLRRVRGRILEILAHAVLELFRLADIDDLAGLILHQIHARFQGKRQRLVFQFFKGHSNKKLPQKHPSLRQRSIRF